MTTYERELIGFSTKSEREFAVELLLKDFDAYAYNEPMQKMKAEIMIVAEENDYTSVEDFCNDDLDGTFGMLCDCGYLDEMIDYLKESIEDSGRSNEFGSWYGSNFY